MNNRTSSLKPQISKARSSSICNVVERPPDHNCGDELVFIDNLNVIENKVITTVVIRPFEDPTRCAQSVVADLAASSNGDCSTPPPPSLGVRRDVRGQGGAYSIAPHGFLLAPH